MKKLIIEGNKKLSGSVKIGGAKNSIVALIPACSLTKGICTINNVPDISDVRILIEIMEYMGSIVTFENEVLIIDNTNFENKKINENFSNKLRASYYFMGSLLSRYHKAEIAYPGGCIIGSRPIDFHIDAFKKMGAKVKEENGEYIISTDNLKGSEIFFDFPSVGATINVMLASIYANGQTVIHNAAKEPEIVNVASFLNSMGAKVLGAGTSRIIIEGVSELGNGIVDVIPDRIEAGTYLIIGSLLGENLKITDIIKEHLDSVLLKLKEANVDLIMKDNEITVSSSNNLVAVDIKTTAYPGFPTDLGQPMSTFLTQCNGESIFEETIYENRLRHIPHLKNMGANIKTFEQTAIITGPTKLKGKNVIATDLRAGASMLVAGMIAEGTTTITNIEHLLRGYEKIVDKLNNIGANIKMIDE